MEWQVTEIATKTLALAQSALWILHCIFPNEHLDCIKNSVDMQLDCTKTWYKSRSSATYILAFIAI